MSRNARGQKIRPLFLWGAAILWISLSACSPDSSSSKGKSAPEDAAGGDAGAPIDGGEIGTSTRVIGETALGRIHRISTTEYKNTLGDLLKNPVDLEGHFPAENVAHGFTNNSEAQNITDMVVERYLEAAEKVSAAALGEETVTARQEVEDMGFTEVSPEEEPNAGQGWVTELLRADLGGRRRQH